MVVDHRMNAIHVVKHEGFVLSHAGTSAPSQHNDVHETPSMQPVKVIQGRFQLAEQVPHSIEEGLPFPT